MAKQIFKKKKKEKKRATYCLKYTGLFKNGPGYQETHTRMFTGTAFEIAKIWPQSRSLWAQEWISNNDVFKQPDTVLKMNESLMLSEKSKLKKYTVYDSIYKKFKSRQNKQCHI